MSDTILVVNAGSSSIKFQLFALKAGEELERRIKGEVEGIGSHPHMRAQGKDGETLVETAWETAGQEDGTAALDHVLDLLGKELEGERPAAIGHRVVHGGTRFAKPILIDDDVVAALEALVPLAPLHQPGNLAPIRALRGRLPKLPQVACFDTAFHRSHPEIADRFAIPQALHAEGIRRYGFHGLSYEYIAAALGEIAPALALGRVIVAHLGNGASICALKSGQSIDSSMSFTALDGLPMGTRPGQLDPGVLLHLIATKGWDAKRLEQFLYHECGLKGLSGLSNDMRDLLASDTPAARLAVDYFVYRVVREAGALAAALGGLDGIVFTAGIGERSAEIRARVCAGLAWLGLELDGARNQRHGPEITKSGSRVSAWTIPTDEERMIARHTRQVLNL
ncbi:MAG TPA: acetate/propionate family kinase [Dongiaceae bacterium]|nr:acetate/propionate family kinase [Dongiaceae bacterium]